jgi:S1-C subfamily serine protease
LLVAVVLLFGLLGGDELHLMAQEQGRPARSAFLVHPNGYLVTAAHVVKDAVKVDVVIGDKSYNATVLGVDERQDLALLQIKAKNLSALPLGNSNSVQVGEEVRAAALTTPSGCGTPRQAPCCGRWQDTPNQYGRSPSRLTGKRLQAGVRTIRQTCGI